MILVDKLIKERSSEIFKEGYDEENVTAISYDLHIKEIISDDKDLKESYPLRPNEFVFIKTKEKIEMPKDLMGRIGEKNSRIRQGLNVVGPHYFPGHETWIFLRVQNVTSNIIRIKTGDTIAQIFFEELVDIPEKTYDLQAGASFNDEDDYKGVGKYKDEYENRLQKIDDVNKSLDERLNNLYANILTFMGLFVSVFSLIMVNFTNICESNMTKEFIIPMNISLGIVITMFIGLILIFVNRAKNKHFLFGFLLLMAVLIFALMSFL